MHVSLTAWIATIAVLAAGRRAGPVARHPEPARDQDPRGRGLGRRRSSRPASCSASASGYFTGHRYGSEFFAGWITEYSLSVDNLFVFVIILTKLRVPRAYQSQVLLWGVLMALVLRGFFIGVGSAVINQFSWIFYVFGAFLVYTAIKLATGQAARRSSRRTGCCAGCAPR